MKIIGIWGLFAIVMMLGCAVPTSVPVSSPADKKTDTDETEEQSIKPLPPTY